jgi:transposase
MERYIYPREDRAIRDLSGKRGPLVWLRTSLILNLENIITRNCGVHLNGNQIKQFKTNYIVPLLEGQKDLARREEISKECIEFLTG